MAVTVSDIRERKEFSNVEATTIQQAIDDATAQVNPDAFGTNADQAVKWLAMALIAESPYGERLRFKKAVDGCMSPYERNFKRLQCRSAIRTPVVVV